MAATNRWLTALQSLKGITENLRTMLATNNIKVYNSDTLSDLIGKVPSMSPIVIDGSKRKKWEPDPLWVFPDPNGSNQAKNIRQIYDEDSLADSYTYRGIYMVRGDYDSLDLKQCMGSTTNKTTFILSDGTRYDDITASSLIHNWDKSKDVIDSSNVPMRYIRIYSDASYSYLPSFYCTVVWCVHNLATSVGTYGSQQCSNISNKHTSMYYNYNIQCVELGSKVTSINGYSSGYFPLGRPYKLVIDGNILHAKSRRRAL